MKVFSAIIPLVLEEVTVIEIRGALEDRPGTVFQEVLVPGEAIVLHEMEREPSSAHRPHHVRRPVIGGGCITPEIDIMV
jgi:hypothetical protein